MTNEYMSSEDKQRKAQDLKNQARADAHELTEKAKLSAEELRTRAQTEARAKAEVGRDQAASEMETLAHAARAAADDLKENQHDALSQYVGGMASSVADFAESLRHKSVDELVRDVEGIARRNPALFIAGSVAVGLGIARFAKASSDRRDRSNYALESNDISGRPYTGAYDAGSYDSNSGAYETGSYNSGSQYSGVNSFASGSSQQPTQASVYDSQTDRNRSYGASFRDTTTDDSLTSGTSSLSGVDADKPERIDETDIGTSDTSSDSYLVKNRDDKSSDSSTSI